MFSLQQNWRRRWNRFGLEAKGMERERKGAGHREEQPKQSMHI
jgi:hypothetical protein